MGSQFESVRRGQRGRHEIHIGRNPKSWRRSPFPRGWARAESGRTVARAQLQMRGQSGENRRRLEKKSLSGFQYRPVHVLLCHYRALRRSANAYYVFNSISVAAVLVEGFSIRTLTGEGFGRRRNRLNVYFPGFRTGLTMRRTTRSVVRDPLRRRALAVRGGSSPGGFVWGVISVQAGLAIVSGRTDLDDGGRSSSREWDQRTDVVPANAPVRRRSKLGRIGSRRQRSDER